jgi:type I restriction-modification system DNA methylase subunit
MLNNRIQNTILKLSTILKNTALNHNEAFDLLLMLIFWKYLSDNYVIDNTKAQKPEWIFGHFEPNFTGKINVGNKLNEGIEALLKGKGLSIEKDIRFNETHFTSVGENIFFSLIQEIKILFDNDWEWSTENIITFFDIFEHSLLSDNIDAHFYLTPREITSLLPSIVNLNSAKNIYDPFCRTAGFLAEAINKNPKSMVKGLSSFYPTFKIAKIKGIMLNGSLWSISNESIYNVSDDSKFDCIITNPPFGGKGIKNNKAQGEWSSLFANIRQELDFVCHVLDHLHNKGTAAIIVPNGLLYNIVMKEFRKKLIEKNLLEVIILLPPGIFFQTNVATAILIFNHDKNNNKTLFIDGTKMGIRHKERHQLSESDVSLISEIVLKHRVGNLDSITDNEDLYITVPSEDFEKNDFNFQFRFYTTSLSEKIKRKPSEIIWQEILSLNNQLTESLNNLKRIGKN